MGVRGGSSDCGSIIEGDAIFGREWVDELIDGFCDDLGCAGLSWTVVVVCCDGGCVMWFGRRAGRVECGVAMVLPYVTLVCCGRSSSGVIFWGQRHRDGY